MPDLAYAEPHLKVRLIQAGTSLAASHPVEGSASPLGGGGGDRNEFDPPEYRFEAEAEAA